MDTNILDTIREYSTLIIAMAVILGGSYPFVRRRLRSPKIANTPILLAYYTENSKLVPVHKTEVQGVGYTAMVAVPKEDSHETATIIHVQLPYITEVHLLGVPKKSNAVQIDPTFADSVMEEVVLEGDYPNYFQLYADKGLQAESRYVLDPSAMLFTVEFCQSHYWEIIKGELYFVQSAQMKNKDDKTHMWADVQDFIEKIRPAIEVKNQDGQDDSQNNKFACPICAKQLQKDGDYFACPDQHGLLVHGSVLMRDLNSVKVKVGRHSNPTSNSNHDLNCPVCGSKMSKEALRSAGSEIDRCLECPYNWFDNGELIK